MTEILIILALIVANGAFAMAEAAVVASRRPRLEQRAASGDKKAAAALALAENPDRFLSTTQIGITLIGIFSGAFGGATLSKALAQILRGVPALAPYADSVALFIVVALISYLSLIIGELVPKRLAMGNPERIAGAFAGPMSFLSKIASPLVSFLAFSSATTLRLLGIKASDEPAVTEEEIKFMVGQGAQSGTFHPAESEMIDRIFRLGDQRVSAIMTRRPDIGWLDIEKSWEENAAQLSASIYSRLPVCKGDLEHVIGVVRAKDVLSQFARGEQPDIETALQPPLFVPTMMPALRLLEALRQKKTHIAIVVNEFGATQGIVTLHDILEAVVGDLPTLDDSDEGYAVRRDDGSFLVEGVMPIDEFEELFEITDLLSETESRVESLSGFVLVHLGHIPSVAESFEAAGLKFEIIDMDGQRIDKILVRRAE
ncbi:MAG TPA: hemolysin family protein [Abditibacterium sp.]|jgi:putative hemolysin